MRAQSVPRGLYIVPRLSADGTVGLSLRAAQGRAGQGSSRQSGLWFLGAPSLPLHAGRCSLTSQPLVPGEDGSAHSVWQPWSRRAACFPPW